MTASPGPVASAVRAELARRGHSQADAAAALHLSRQTMSLRLNGRANFRVGELHALAAWLGVDVSVLMDEARALERTEAPSSHPVTPQAIPA